MDNFEKDMENFQDEMIKLKNNLILYDLSIKKLKKNILSNETKLNDKKNLGNQIRTSDLMNYSPPVYQLSYTEKKKVLSGFEPELLDSKSSVLTNYTIEPKYPKWDSNPQPSD